METKLTPWKITWDNDTGPNDDCYAEWFTVSNGIVEYECDTQEDAEELVKTLTEHSQLLQQRDELMEALLKCKPYMSDLELDNIDDQSVGIRKDYELYDAWQALLKALNNIQKHQI